MSKYKKFCYFVSPYDLPDRHISRNFELASAGQKYGYNTCIICNNFSHREKKRYIISSKFELFSIEWRGDLKVVWIKTSTYRGNGWDRVLNSLLFSVMSFIYLLIYAERRSIFVSDNLPFNCAISTLLCSIFKRGKFCLQVRDVWPEALVFEGHIKKRGIAHRWFSFLEKLTYRYADGIVSSLPYVARYLRKEHPQATAPVVYIPNPVGEAEASFGSNAPVGSSKLVVYAGGLGAAHDIITLLEGFAIAAAVYPGLIFRIYASGPRLDEVELWIRMHSDLDVRVMPLVSKTELQKILRAADVLVAALYDNQVYRHGLNLNKINDYFAAARPIVLACSSPHRIIDDADAGRQVIAENPSAVGGALLEILSLDPSRAAKLGNNGRKFLLASRSIDVLGEKMFEFCDFLNSRGAQ